MFWETSVKATVSLPAGFTVILAAFYSSSIQAPAPAQLLPSELAAILSLSLNKSVFDTVPQVHLLCP